MKPFATLLISTLLALATAAAWADPIAKDGAPAINVTPLGIKKTTQFRNWKVNLDTTAKIGTFSRGMFCAGTIDMPYTKNYDQYFVGRLRTAFKDTGAALGYPKFEGGDSAFADKTAAEADFRVGFSLMALHYDICINGKDMAGKAAVTLKFELYSNKFQKVMYAKTIEGSFASDDKIKENAFHDGLFASALNQLFADPKYVDAFKDNVAASDMALAVIAVKNGVKQNDSIKKNSKDLISAVVTIETGMGAGSGFYIGREGYIISNYHVVGDAKYVKVKLMGGFAVPGEVVRRDPVRDVALIKTDIEPPAALFVRATPAKIGEEVFAIGSPFGAQLSGTLTRGILSAERTMSEQKFLQSDVSINPGNSGGPLVDVDGAVIAIADMKAKNASGIGLFIPIAEVFDKLGLNLQ